MLKNYKYVKKWLSKFIFSIDIRKNLHYNEIMKPTHYTQPKNELESQKRDSLFFKIDHQLLHIPSFHDSHELIYLLEGTATATISGVSYAIKAGDICFINPNQVHYYDAVWGEVRAIIFVAGRDFSHHLRAAYAKQSLPCVMRNAEENAKVKAILEEWLAREDKSFLLNCGYANLVYDALVKAYGVFEQSSEFENEQQAFRFLSYIRENYAKSISLETAAAYFSYSKEYFCSLFSRLVGQSFLTVLNSTRIEKAIEMINDPGNTKSIERISVECGYNSTSTFYRQYKAYLKKNS